MPEPVHLLQRLFAVDDIVWLVARRANASAAEAVEAEARTLAAPQTLTRLRTSNVLANRIIGLRQAS